MLKRWQIAVLVLLAIVAALFAGSFFFPPEYQICTPNEYTHAKECAQYHGGPFVFRWVITVIDAHNGLVTAIATVFVAGFTWTLWRSSEATIAQAKATGELAEKQFLMEGRQADLAEKQHGLMRLQHIAANKPRLRIRAIILNRTTPSGEFFENGEIVRGHIFAANAGATEAKIIDSACRFYWSNDGLPMQPPLDDDEALSLPWPREPVPGYGSISIPIASAKPLPAIADSIRNRNPQGWRLYVMGYIHYSDINSAERFMGFCREYVAPDPWWGAEGRFKPVDNSDYEYED